MILRNRVFDIPQSYRFIMSAMFGDPSSNHLVEETIIANKSIIDIKKDCIKIYLRFLSIQSKAYIKTYMLLGEELKEPNHILYGRYTRNE
jgi:hypothetical protein